MFKKNYNSRMKPPVVVLFSIFQIIYNPDHLSPDTVRPIPYAQMEFGHADTTVGRVKGLRQISRGNKVYIHFRGIPYAKPPIDDLRFEPPESHSGWDETLDATQYKPDCPQVNSLTRGGSVYGKEDCLFINVATKKTYFKSDTPTKKFRPVIVWIHGGHFMLGSSHAYSPKYWMEEDIVFVTFNYRLGALGFLNTGDGTVAGNMGLKDQVFALKWIQENIKYFNGDPEKVYLLGENAGAIAVHMHTLSPMSKDLFAGAVSMGGTALSPWGLVPNPAEQANEMAKALKCDHKKKKLLKCLRNLPAEAIADYHLNYFGKELVGQRAYFGPTIETVELENEPAFLPQHPLDLLNNESILKVPWVNGVNSGDGISALIAIMRDEHLRNLVNSKWSTFAPALLFYRNHSNSKKLSQQVRKYYLNNEDISMDTFPNASNMTSDRMFFLDSYNATVLHSKVAPVYSYYYDYKGQYSFSTLSEGGGGQNPLETVVKQGTSFFGNLGKGDIQLKLTQYACHGDELPLMFSMPMLRVDIEQSDSDYEFSRKLIRIWVSFAKTGTLDLNDIEESVKWKPIKQSSGNPKPTKQPSAKSKPTKQPSAKSKPTKQPGEKSKPTKPPGEKLKNAPLKRLVLNKEISIAKEPFFKRMKIWKKYNVEEEMYEIHVKGEKSNEE